MKRKKEPTLIITSISITPSQKRFLVEKALEKDISVSQYIRRLVRARMAGE